MKWGLLAYPAVFALGGGVGYAVHQAETGKLRERISELERRIARSATAIRQLEDEVVRREVLCGGGT